MASPPAKSDLLVAALGGALVLLSLGYVAVLWSFDALPFQDVPNHLARAVITADLLFHGGGRFGGEFSLALLPRPYVLGDLALAGLVEAFGPYAGARLWTVVIAASLPLSLVVYLRASGASTQAILLGAIFGLYLGTDWSFLMGFQAFRLAVALTILGLAAWQAFLARGTAASYLAFAGCLLAGYLTHLSALVFGGLGAGVIAAYALASTRTPLSRVLLGGLPLAALGGWQLASAGVAPEGITTWDPALLKLKRLATPFRRIDLPTDVALFGLLLAAVALLLRPIRSSWRSERFAVPALLSAAFVATYAALPMGHAYVCHIDSRALAFAAAFGVLAAVGGAEAGRLRSATAALLAVLLATATLAMLHVRFGAHNEELRRYREIAARVPPGAIVLPVAARAGAPVIDPLLHAGLFATIESGAATPYLFHDGVTPHFHWRRVLEAPHERWYERGERPDGLALAATYDYLLVTRPYDPARLPVETETLAQNETAALLRVVKAEGAGRPGAAR